MLKVCDQRVATEYSLWRFNETSSLSKVACQVTQEPHPVARVGGGSTVALGRLARSLSHLSSSAASGCSHRQQYKILLSTTNYCLSALDCR